MPKFSQESFSRLSTCHLDLQALFYEVIKSFDCTILVGYRNEEDQEKAFENGHTQLHWPNSKHNTNPSFAVDVAPYPLDWNDAKEFYFFGGYVLGIAQKLKDEGKITHSIRWGGDWDSTKHLNKNGLNDLVHFELVE